jgi:hypothetical protein
MNYVWFILIPIIFIFAYDIKNRYKKRKSGRFDHESDSSKEGRNQKAEGETMQHFSSRKY